MKISKRKNNTLCDTFVMDYLKIDLLGYLRRRFRFQNYGRIQMDGLD